MRGSDWRNSGVLARRQRRAARAFRPEWNAAGMGLENRLMPAITLSPATLPNDTINHAYDETVVASGGTGGYTYAVTTGALPDGLSLNATTGAITGTPSVANTFNFTITATDSSSDTGSQAYTVTINPAIAFTTTTVPATTVNTSYSQQIAATGGTGALTFAVTTGSLPAGLSLSSSGLISGTPTAAGAFNFTVTATDTVGATASQAYSETINPAIAFTTTTFPGATINTAYNKQIATTGGTGTVTFAVTTGTLPAGLTLSASGVLSGTPTAAGNSTFTVTATDTVGATTTQGYSFVVNAAIAFTTTTLPDTTVGAGYSQQIATTGGTGTLTFAITTGSLPAGLSISSSGLITGTPTSPGQSTFTVTATDANNASSSQAYTIDVNGSIVFSTTTLPAATANTGYNQQIAATGGTGALTFAITSGTLPAGLSFSSAGVITGTPTTPGNSSFTVTATDTVGATTTQNFTITVNSGTSATGPTVTSLQRFGFHAQPTVFVLTFSEALDATSAENLSNYTLVPFANGFAGAPIALASAVYDSTTNSVTLTPVRNVYLYAQYQLTVNGKSPSGLTDTSGNFLAGANSQSGTNYVKVFGKEILSGPNLPSGTPTSVANFINNEWTNQLASRFAALASAAGDITAAAMTARSSAKPAVKITPNVSRSTMPLVTVPSSAAAAAVSAALSEVQPETIDDVLAAIVPADTDKKK